MKICHLSSVHSVLDTRIFHKELKSLAKNNYDLSFIVPHTKDEHIENIKIISLIKFKNRLCRMLITPFLLLYKSLKRNAKIYHFHDPELLFVGMFLKLIGKKVVYDVHEDVPRQILSKHYLNKNIAKIISFAFEKIENFCSKYFDCIITATPFINDRFIKINKNSININNYPIIKNEYLTYNKNFEKLENTICYVGGLTKIRGIKTIIEALEKTEGIKLILVGSFSPASFETECRNLKGWEKVEYIGQVLYKDVFKVMDKSKIGLVLFQGELNHINSQPNKIFEYMMAGLPVLCSDFDLWRSIVEKEACGFCVNPSKVDDISKYISILINDHELLNKMSKNGIFLIKDKYNWEKEEIKLLKIYKELCF